MQAVFLQKNHWQKLDLQLSWAARAETSPTVSQPAMLLISLTSIGALGISGHLTSLMLLSPLALDVSY
jgi:hypothetical protein